MKPSRTTKRIITMVIVDSLCLAVALLVFAFFHHVYSSYFGSAQPQALPQAAVSATAEPEPEVTPEPVVETATETVTADTAETTDAQPAATAEPTPEPTAVPTGLLGGKYQDKFSYTGTVKDDTSYRSANVAVELTTTEAYDSIIHVLDIYIQNLSSFRTYVPRNEGSKSKELMPIEADTELGGVIAVTSGDQFYSHSVKGYIVRNGNLYYSTKDPSSDVCILYSDGTMATFSGSAFDPDTEVAKGVQQVWSFGPALLDNGTALTSFKSSVSGKNPRLAIGYFEPGHYCLVEVDASRNSDNSSSKGVTLAELAQFFESLGCQVAYNLDGGGTAGMVFNSTKICKPGRRATDLIYICEPTEAAN